MEILSYLSVVYVECCILNKLRSGMNWNNYYFGDVVIGEGCLPSVSFYRKSPNQSKTYTVAGK